MDIVVAIAAGALVVNGIAVLIWTTWVAWHRMHGKHVNWW